MVVRMVTACVETAISAGSVASPRYRSEPVTITCSAFYAARLPGKHLH